MLSDPVRSTETNQNVISPMLGAGVQQPRSEPENKQLPRSAKQAKNEV